MKNTKQEELAQHGGLTRELEEQKMIDIIRPVRTSNYVIDVPVSMVNAKIKDLAEDAISMGGKLVLNPDFQRGHVWSQDKQIGYIENLLRNIAPNILRFNCPHYFTDKTLQGLNGGDILCVDGLQRMTAMKYFMDGKFKVFERYYAEDLKKTKFDLKRYTFKLEIFDIPSKKELIRFYLDLNTGGVVHSDEEIERVSNMMNEL